MTGSSLQFALPWPPTENTYRRFVKGNPRPLISDKGRRYKATVIGIIRASRYNRELAGRLEVEIMLRPPDRRRRDIDNTLKALLDAMQAGGVYLDDSQIDSLHVQRCEPVKDGMVWVEITERTHNKDAANLAKGGKTKNREET